MHRSLMIAVTWLLLFAAPIHAHTPSQPPHQRFPMGDLRLESGEVIRARTLILHGTGDLLNPEYEPIDAARFIRDVRVVRISPGTITGHASAGGGFPADVDFLNREVATFLAR